MCELQSEQLSEVLFTELSSTMNRASLYLAPFVARSKLPSSAEAQFSLYSWESRGWKSDLSKVTASQEPARNKVQRREWRSETAWMTRTTAALGKGCKHANDECQEGWKTCTYSTEDQTSLQQENT